MRTIRLILVTGICTAAVAGALTFVPAVKVWWAGRLLDKAASEIPYRTSDGRLSGFDYRRRGSVRGDEANIDLNVRAVAARANAIGGEDSYRVRGIAALLLNDAKTAVQSLEKASSEDPENESIWNDLAVAYLTSARANDDPHAAALALAAADRAIARNPRFAEAIFNRARALAVLRIRSAAIAAHERYLAVDPTSPWSGEIRESLSDLERQAAREWKRDLTRLIDAVQRRHADTVLSIVRLYPQEARTWTQTEFLADWGQSYLEKNARAAEDKLRLAREIGTALAAVNEDVMVRDIVVTIDHAEDPAGLARAHVIFRDARRTYAQRRVAAALPMLREAGRLLGAHHSALAFEAMYFEANALHDQNDEAQAEDVLRKLMQVVPPSYKALHAELRWQAGTIHATQGRLVEAIASYGEAAERFSRIGEVANAATVSQMLATRYQEVDQTTEAWRHVANAFAVLDGSRTEDLQRALTGAMRGEMEHEHWHVVRSLAGVAQELNLVNVNARREANLWALRAQSNSHIAPGEVHVNVEKAKAAADRIEDVALRDAAHFDIRRVEAIAAMKDDPRRAVALLSENIQWAERAHYVARIAEQYLERSRGNVALGRVDDAVADVGEAFAFITRQGRSLDNASRAALLRAVDPAVDDLVSALADLGRVRGAISVLDRAALAMDGNSARTRPTGTRPLEANETLVSYRQLPDGILILTLTRARATAHRTVRPASATEQRIQSLFGAAQRADEATMEDLCDRFYDDLIRPIRNLTTSGGVLVIVPDGTLANIPFAALRDRRTGRRVIEGLQVVFARSAVGYVASREHATLNVGIRPLIVSNPAFSRTLLPSMESLGEAGREGIEVAKIYKTTALNGPAATAPDVFARLRTATMFHYAGHALVNDVDSRNSCLVLAPDKNSAGLLYLREIEALDLSHLQIVVLAGCRTTSASGRYRHPVGIATGFLSAGVRTVVGAVWDADDRATRRFSRQLHAMMAKGRTPAEAVWEAQIELMGSSDPAFAQVISWGQFQVWVA